MRSSVHSLSALDGASGPPDDATPETLIGTTWIAGGTAAGIGDSIEFVDGTYCIYTSRSSWEPYTYRIRENRILVGGLVSFVIRNNTLYLNGYSLFIKARPPSASGRVHS
jgi:hypothetical protein